MMRFMGALLILLACAAFSMRKTAGMKNRMHTLCALMDALQLIRSEITTNLTPVTEILLQLENHQNAVVRGFAAKVNENINREGIPYFSRCWSDAVIACCADLTVQEREALCALGNILGRYTESEECAAIDRCTAALRDGFTTAKEKYAADAKLYTGLSMVTGLMLVILLL